MSNKDRLLANAARSTTYNIALQIALRILTFVTNSFIVHYVSKDVLGVVNVRLTLLYSTTQFISREAFRRACSSIQDNKDWALVVNLLWLTVPVSIALSVGLRLVWLYLLSQPDALIIPGYAMGVNCVLLSVVIEMLAEPVYILAQLSQFIKLRVIIEGVSLTVKCLLMAFLIVQLPNQGVYAFATAQLIASLIYSTSYYTFAQLYIDQLQVKTFRRLLPDFHRGIDWDLFYLMRSFFKQTCVKQILTEGERYIMTMFNLLSFAEQGVYDIVNNLGSLAARFIFHPIEESSYIFFAQSLSRGSPIMEDTFVSRALEQLLKIMLLIGAIVLAFGITYTEDALFLYGGLSLATGLGPILLRWHCVYIIFLALNGPTECFVFATMNSDAIEKYNSKLVYLSLTFMITSYGLASIFGSVGFILANCFNMAIRIGHSLHYIKGYFKKQKPLAGLTLRPAIIAALVISNQLTWHSASYLNYNKGIYYLMGHIAIGGICLVITCGVIYQSDKSLVRFAKSFFTKKNE